MEDTATLALGGTVSLGSFARALDRFTKVLDALAAEADARIEWVIAGLDYGSAVATAAGRGLDDASEALVPTVVSRYVEAGEAIAYGRPSATSQKALEFMADIARLIDDQITEVRFETAEREAVVRGDLGRALLPRPQPSKDRGTVVGRVQTLQGRGQLRFTLYDHAHDRAVSCYLQAGQEELMRGAWGHLVEVEGIVSRDPVTNFPLTVRQVDRVTVFPEPDPTGFLRARGAVSGGDESAEAVIRRLRDAG